MSTIPTMTPEAARAWLADPANFWPNDELCYLCGTEHDELAVERGGLLFCRERCCNQFARVEQRARQWTIVKSALLSDCLQYRYWLARQLAARGRVIAFFGINPSTADAQIDDNTVKKWTGFCSRWGNVREFVVGNAFAYRATDVRQLRSAADPVGPHNDAHLQAIIERADILIPCWGDSGKVPRELRPRLDAVLAQLVASGKPVFTFGSTAAGDPRHPLMLPYSTPLVIHRPRLAA